MEVFNIYAAWTGIALGFITGAISGLFFYRSDWLGGYTSWPRRMVRLGHISLFGLAFINLAFAYSVHHLEIEDVGHAPSVLLIIGAFTMPSVCYGSAFVEALRWLFFIPVSSLILGAAWFIIGDLIL